MDDFQKIGRTEFFSNMYSLGLLLNVDWFNPFKHVEYSVGSMYLAINFPRQLRYRKENMIQLGIIPGPREPSLHMNSYLEAMARELQQLWKGIEMITPDGVKLVRAALCTAADISATRKLGGFVGHSANKGCSRCLKYFPTLEFGGKPDYSGFDRSYWPKRKLLDHKAGGMNWKLANTLKKRQDIEHNYGFHFSELLRLPYFNSIRFAIVDPTHNVLLGSAKHLMLFWKDNKTITEIHFSSIQCVVDKFVTPADIGRTPY